MASSALFLYTCARIVVQFLEALAKVRDLRREDEELLVLCRQGAARGSAKMRAACLNAHADLASPIIFKAVLFAWSAAFDEFCMVVGSPSKLGITCLFFVVTLIIPFSQWTRWGAGMFAAPVSAPLHGIHYVAYNTEDDASGGCAEHGYPLLREWWHTAKKKPLLALRDVESPTSDAHLFRSLHTKYE